MQTRVQKGRAEQGLRAQDLNSTIDYIVFFGYLANREIIYERFGREFTGKRKEAVKGV